MSVFSDYLTGQLLNLIFRTASYSKPSTLAIALCTAAPVVGDTGATIPEVANTGSYMRQVLNPADANWAASSPGVPTTNNLMQITFPTATADWGVITYIALLDNSTYGAGNLLMFGSLTVSKTVSTGDIFEFTVTDLVFGVT